MNTRPRLRLASLLLPVIAAAIAASFAGPLAARDTAAREATTREWNFDVTLDGRPIGEHRFSLRDDHGWRELTSEASFRVRFLFIDAYRYEHRALERWRGDCLQSVEARTNANGSALVVAGQRAADAFELRSGGAQPGGTVLRDECVQTFAYWNPGILDARRLLNPQTGEYVDVKVLLMGREMIDGHPADRYRLIGGGRSPLQIDLWYTPAREWIALESLTADGRHLRYARK